MNYLLQIFSEIDIDRDEVTLPRVTPTEDSIANILSTVFQFLGAISVLVIVIAGLYFVLSRGNPEKANRARDAIIYAMVGLVLATLAFTIVRFVAGSL